MGMPSSPVIELSDVVFSWTRAAPLLAIPALRLAASEQLFVAGPSGSGKSTLLSLLAGVVTPAAGRVAILGTALSTLSGGRRDRFRADHIGLIFQQFNLLPYLSIVDNVLLPCRFSRYRRERLQALGSTPEQAAHALLERLELPPHLWSRPVRRLSVGQQQRVAAARALIGRPAVVLADEPTSALDARLRTIFMTMLQEECRAAGAALVFVSHDDDLAQRFDRRLDLAPSPDAAGVESRAW
jgi:putative ABC transport system ATP-binding protein